MSRSIRLLAGLGLGLLAGCDVPPPNPDNDPVNNPVFEAEPRELTTLFTGYAWDPEVYLIAFASCAPPCFDLMPFVADVLPPFNDSLVGGANISVVDGMTGQPAGTVGQSGMFDATFVAEGVPSSPSTLYLLQSDGAGELLAPPFGPPPPAPTTYNPTITLRPISAAGSPTCAMLESAQIGSNGVLEAVANFRGIAVADLLDPIQFSAVTVFWSWEPTPFFMRVPAGDILYQASAGDVHHLLWAPPGDLPPGVQSERGFFVDTFGSGSPMGLAVGVVPATVPLEGPVEYLATDLSDDPMFGRPWMTAPIAVFPVPGVITSVPVHFFPGGPPPGEGGEGEGPPPDPEWLCFPPFGPPEEGPGGPGGP